MIDKEILIEELEEHLRQTRSNTFGNPFVSIPPMQVNRALVPILNALEYELAGGYERRQMIVMTAHLSRTTKLLLDHIKKLE